MTRVSVVALGPLVRFLQKFLRILSIKSKWKWYNRVTLRSDYTRDVIQGYAKFRLLQLMVLYSRSVIHNACNCLSVGILKCRGTAAPLWSQHRVLKETFTETLQKELDFNLTFKKKNFFINLVTIIPDSNSFITIQ